MKKRILSSFLSLVLVLSLMPVSALAAEGPRMWLLPMSQRSLERSRVSLRWRRRPAGRAGLHLRVPLYRGDREHGLPHLHGGLYRLAPMRLLLMSSRSRRVNRENLSAPRRRNSLRR